MEIVAAKWLLEHDYRLKHRSEMVTAGEHGIGFADKTREGVALTIAKIELAVTVGPDS